MALFKSTPSQTRFVAEEPFLEAEQQIFSDETEQPAPASNPKKKLIIVGIIGGVVLLLVFILTLLLRPKEPVIDPGPGDITPTPIPANLDPLSKDVDQLKQQLQAADPSVQVFIYPVMDTNLRIEKQRRF